MKRIILPVVVLTIMAVLAPQPVAAEAAARSTDCDSLSLSAEFVAAQLNATRANPARSLFDSAPALALQNVQWADLMSRVFEALERQVSSRPAREAFASARATMEHLASVKPPRASLPMPQMGCMVQPNGAPAFLKTQLLVLEQVERELRQTSEAACAVEDAR